MTNHTTLRLLAAALVLASLFTGFGAATAAPQVADAELAIEQPDYISQEVGTARANNGTVYVVHHGQVEIKPQNFNADDVVGFGVSTSSGELTYNDQFETFTFDAQDNTGTFELYWEVEQTRVVETNNSTTTETVTRRYESTIRVEQDKAWTHLTSDPLESTREKAANWDEWTQALENIWGENVDIAQKTSWSVDVNEVRANPLSVLSGGYTGFIVALFMTISGVLVLLTFGILHIYSTIQDKIAIHRNETLKADEADIDERLDEIDHEKRLKRFANLDFQDLDWPDSVSRSYRRIGDTPMKAVMNLMSARLPENLLSFRLQAMGVDGYVGAVKREDVATDGGNDGTDAVGVITHARVVDEDDLDLGEGEERIELNDELPEEFISAVRGDSKAIHEYDLTQTSAGPDDISVEHTPLELDDLMEELEVQRQDFDTADEWGQYLEELIQFVLDHQITNEHGEFDRVQVVLNEWLDTDDAMADIYDIPHAKYEAEAISWAIEQRDPVEEAQKIVEDHEQGKHT